MSRTVFSLALVLLAAAACTQGRRTSKGACANPSGSGTTASGSLACFGSEVRSCTSGVWTTSKTCNSDQYCQSGQCYDESGTDTGEECSSSEEGSSKCSGDSKILKCEKSGDDYRWRYDRRCSGTCSTEGSEAQCTDSREDLEGDTCTSSGTRRCGRDDVLYECQLDGGDRKYRKVESCQERTDGLKYCEDSGSNARCSEGTSSTGLSCSARDRTECRGSALYRCVPRAGSDTSLELVFDTDCARGGGTCSTSGGVAACTGTSGSCTSGSGVRCGDGSCVDARPKCNGHPDCSDAADEKGCSGSCGNNRCGGSSGFCLPEEAWCDPMGYKDCPNGEDEKDCEALAPRL